MANTNTDNIDNIDFLKESSYLFPDFKDIADTYTNKQIYPLDYIPLIDSLENQEILDIILSDIPFYQITPKTVLFKNDIDKVNKLSESRDSGIVNVPSIMQTNDFYQTWFREAWGYLYNKLILDVFNKLRYPFISEHQYLMIDTISSMIEKTFKGDDIKEIELNKDYSYLNEVIKSKIDSTTALLGITFNNNEFLDNVIESMYYGGILSSEEKDTEKYIFLLQEIKNELLKRKLAGTFTMYKMAISSLGRNGSFVNACKVKEFLHTNKPNTSSNVERYYRYVNILGLTTKKADAESFDLQSIYKNIPQKLLSEIFFSSSNANYFNSSVNNKNTYLRDNVSVVNWNALENIVSQENIVNVYDTFDMLETHEDEEKHIALDRKSLKYNNDDIPRYFDHTTNSIKFKSLLSANILDISADQLLYHDYTRTSGIDSSQYLTYSIANGNGISLMDTFWLDYIENSLKDKTKVVDNTLYGVQVSKYVDLSSLLAEKNFFGYTKDNEKVYLYYCTIKYSIKNYSITDATKKLITTINYRKKDDSNDYYNRGVIPFTYKDYVGDTIKDMDSETLEYKGYNECYFAFSSYDITKKLLPNGNPKDYTSDIIHSYIPDEDIRTIYYIVPRKENNTTQYYWSEPINVINLGEENNSWFDIENLRNKHFSPDWKGLAFYLNPYLNFTKESASPLRHKKVFTTAVGNNISEGASENTCLCNLTRMRELDYWANDDDSKESSIWSTQLFNDGFSIYTSNKLGFYLHKSSSGELTSNKDASNAKIYGDNRSLDILDVRDYNDTLLRVKELSTDNVNAAIKDIISDNSLTPSSDTLYIVTFVDKYIKYYTYNSENSSYDEIMEDSLKKLSIAYTDSNFNDYCISIQKDDKFTDNNLAITNYLEIVSSTKKPTKSCYWNDQLFDDQTEWGKTICMNVHFGNDFSITDDKEYSLISQENFFSLVIYKDKDGYKIKFYWHPTRDDELTWFATSKKIDLEQNLRISASAYFVNDYNTGDKDYDKRGYLKVFLSLIVNGDLNEVSFKIPINDEGTSTAYYDMSEGEINNYTEFCSGNKSITPSNKKYYENPDLFKDNIPIYIGYNSTKKTTTFMDIFDLRLYNEGKSPEELRILNMGTMYELYSYSPCAYNLAHNLYTDMGIFKISNTFDDTSKKELNLIRLFNRDVWDSILVDNFPITEVEKTKGPQKKISWGDPKNDTDIYRRNNNGTSILNDCIEQDLISDVEVYNNEQLSEEIILKYNGEDYNISKEDCLDIVLSTISPSVGNAVALDNNISATLDSDNKTVSFDAVSIPIDKNSSDDYFSYSADLYPSFKLDNNISLDSWLTRGNNITVVYDESHTCNLVTLADTSIKDSERNSAVYPLYVPDADSISFSIKDYKLSNTLCQLLKATSYYTEVCIPVPCKRKNEDSYVLVDTADYTVGNYIPCYYTLGSNDTYVKATGVFQSGITYYTTTDGTTFEKASIYEEDVIPAYFTKLGNDYTQCDGKDTFASNITYYQLSTQYIPTYHYKWDGIRLLKSGDYKVTCKYPMRIRHFNPSNVDDSSTTTFYGTLSFDINVVIIPANNTGIADNFTKVISPNRKEYYKDNLGNHITYVDPEVISEGNTLKYRFPHANVIITVNCNGIDITPSADGFVSNSTPFNLNKFYKSVDADDATDNSFIINVGDAENLTSKDKITLNRNTAYELFIDYDGCVTELSLGGYNILENINTTDYSNFMYTKDISDNLNIDSTKNSGFEVSLNNTLKDKSDDNTTFGDYTKIALDKNALYSLLKDSSYSKQWDVDNSYPIYYFDTIDQDILNATSTIYSETQFVSPAILSEVIAFTDIYGTTEKTNLTEKTILEDVYNELALGNSLLKISGNSSMGLLSGLGSLNISTVSNNLSINLDKYNLYAYKKPALELNNNGNSEEQVYTSINSNNLFGNDVYSFIKDDWTIKYDNYSQDIKISDFGIHGGKRCLQIKRSGNTVTLQSKENIFNKFGTFSVSLTASGVSDATVNLINYTSANFDNEPESLTLDGSNDKWSGKGSKSLLVNKVEIELTFDDNSSNITISDLSIVKTGSDVKDTTNGIYNGYSNSTYNNIYLPSYEVVVLEDKDNIGKYIPIQFKSSIIVGNDGYSRPNYGSTKAMTFITNNSYRDYEDTSSIKGLINPWKKQISITRSITGDNLMYNIYSYTKDMNGAENTILMNDTSLYKFGSNSITLNTSEDNYAIIIESLHYDFSKYASNLSINSFILTNESINYIYNCFNINSYTNNSKSNVLVTNIQFLNKNNEDKTILYELEYLPIIYDEKKHHLSINLMLKKN